MARGRLAPSPTRELMRDLGRERAIRRVFGSRRATAVLAWWGVTKVTWRWTRVHPVPATVILVLLMLMGWTGTVIGVLAGAAAAGWALLAWERKGKPHWLTFPAVENGWHSLRDRDWWRGWERNPLGPRACLVLAAGSFWTILWLPMLIGQVLTVPAAAVLLMWVAHLRVPAELDGAKWTDETALLRMLRHPRVGVVPPMVKGDRRVWLSRKGQPWSDERGEHVRLRFPDESVIGWEDVAKASRQIATFYGLDRSQIQVTHQDGDPEGLLVLSRLKLVTPLVVQPRLSPLCTATRTDALEPFEFGLDKVTGQPMLEDNREANAIYGAAPRSGKTTHVRSQALDFALDPDAYLLGGDGKGSRDDYELLAEMVEVMPDGQPAWVWGTDPDAPKQMVRLLKFAIQVVQHRNSTRLPKGTRWAPILLLLEELQEIRAADAEIGEEIDSLLGRLIRMSGAANLKTVISTQRPSVEDIPSGCRNLVNNRHAGWIANAGDWKLTLGESPTVPIPRVRKGEWISKTSEGQRVYLSDLVPDEDWERQLRRALAVRRVHRREPLLPTLAPVLELPPQRDAVDPVLARVLVVCREQPQRASVLLSELDEDLRPTGKSPARDLGLHLARFPQYLSRGSYKGRDCWHLTTLGRTLADSLADPPSAPWYQGQNDPIGASA